MAPVSRCARIPKPKNQIARAHIAARTVQTASHLELIADEPAGEKTTRKESGRGL